MPRCGACCELGWREPAEARVRSVGVVVDPPFSMIWRASLRFANRCSLRTRRAVGRDAPRYLIRGRDTSYGPVFVQRLRAMGIRERPTAPRSPRQNAYVERLIGSIRRECLDNVIVFGEAHLRRILGAYAAYYNESRTHRSLKKNTPVHRAIQPLGIVTSQPVLGGLHHAIAESNFRYTASIPKRSASP